MPFVPVSGNGQNSFIDHPWTISGLGLPSRSPKGEGWWGKQDSNLRRRSQRIYSPPPLPLGTFPHTDQTPACKSDLTSAMSNIRSTWAYRPHPRCRRGPLYGGPWGGCQHEKAIWGEARAKSYWKSMPPHPVGSSCQAPCPGAQHQT